MELNEILSIGLKSGASDIHLKVGLPPIYRIDGTLRPLPNAPRITPEFADNFCAQIMNELQRERFAREGVHCNARMRPRHLQRFCRPDAAGQALLEKVTDRLGLSARSYTRILKVARTIADLAGSEQVATAHLAEAIQYRSLDRRLP